MVTLYGYLWLIMVIYMVTYGYFIWLLMATYMVTLCFFMVIFQGFVTLLATFKI